MAPLKQLKKLEMKVKMRKDVEGVVVVEVVEAVVVVAGGGGELGL